MRKRFRYAHLLLAAIGVVLAAYLLEQHYAVTPGDFCNINDTFNCTTVNQSAYAELLGVPVALFGLLYYVGLGALALLEKPLRKRFALDDATYAYLLLGYAILGLLFTAYLTAIEAFVLHVYCPLCLGSAAVVVAANALAIAQWRAAT